VEVLVLLLQLLEVTADLAVAVVLIAQMAPVVAQATLLL
jgi:hypothetical protein